jgi:hypothetical protein
MLEEIVENTHKLLDADLEILNSINKDDLKTFKDFRWNLIDKTILLKNQYQNFAESLMK